MRQPNSCTAFLSNKVVSAKGEGGRKLGGERRTENHVSPIIVQASEIMSKPLCSCCAVLVQFLCKMCKLCKMYEPREPLASSSPLDPSMGFYFAPNAAWQKVQRAEQKAVISLFACRRTLLLHQHNCMQLRTSYLRKAFASPSTIQ